jgi:phosphatidylinositol alpha-mannosyltransferase
LRTFQPDVLHLHEPLSPGPNHAALVGTTLPAVGTFHSARAGRNGWYETFRPGLKPMMRRLAVSTAVSEEAKRQVTQTFGGECEIVPNGVDVPSLATGPVTPSVAPAILFVGRHERRKGLEVLLDAFVGLERDAHLGVIGDGLNHDALRGRRVPRIEWLEGVSAEEEQARLRGATIACFPSRESFGWCRSSHGGWDAGVASDIDGYRAVSRSDRRRCWSTGRRRAPPGLRCSTTGGGPLVVEGARADEFSMMPPRATGPRPCTNGPRDGAAESTIKMRHPAGRVQAWLQSS